MGLGPSELVAGECHVWWARPLPTLAGLADLLDSAEQARARRFRRPHDRLRFIAARALARSVLGRYLCTPPGSLQIAASCTICAGPHGKPKLVVPATDMEISLSHSGERVTLAVARGVAVGVDVEALTPDRDLPTLGDSVLSPPEQHALDSIPEPERNAAFLRYWTRKEALLKATGDGLSVPLNKLTVSPPQEPARLLAWVERDMAAVQLHDLSPDAAHTGCLAVLTNRPHTIVEIGADPLLTKLARQCGGSTSSNRSSQQ